MKKIGGNTEIMRSSINDHGSERDIIQVLSKYTFLAYVFSFLAYVKSYFTTKVAEVVHFIYAAMRHFRKKSSKNLTNYLAVLSSCLIHKLFVMLSSVAILRWAIVIGNFF